ncbi:MULTISPECIES: glycosyltransferase family 4 protein [unclassified Roseibium]|uniref:glycosyltransferase family 4 protein n=1 Tax=unclassified Roseibium TaxID=2629323 RepID=UPI00273D4305|nr:MULTISPECIES: glycosyltransferase family 4 protein [unclassified Roseibium]
MSLPTAPTVLQVIPDLNSGGAERTTVDIARALIAAGGTALVASQGGQMVRELEDIGAQHFTLPVKSKNPVTLWKNAGLLSELIRAQDVDIIHARSRAPAWSSLFAARRTHIPFVTTYHGSYSQSNAVKGLYNSIMARGDTVIANSKYIADLIADRHPFAKDRITVIHRGSDLKGLAPENVSALRRQALKDSWGVPTGRPIIMNMARLTSWKGQKVLIEAMGALKASGVTAPIAILAGDAQGRDGYVAELKQLIADWNLQDQVRLVGHCADVPAAMALSDLAVVASIEPEAFGRAAVEAQAARVPVIVSDLGAVPETVLAPPDAAEKDRTGWRVPPGDSDALASAIKTALALSAEDRLALTGRGLTHASRNFTVETMCAKTLDVYAKLLDR